MDVRSLHLYPVKSLRGNSVSEVVIDALGLTGDRRFMVTDAQGAGLTQRTHPRMALIATALDATALVLSGAGLGTVRIARNFQPDAEVRPTKIFSTEGLLAEDCGDEAAAWLSQALADQCRLVRIGPRFHRGVKPAKAKPGDVIAFTDAYPFMVVSEASLEDLNGRLIAQGQESLPMNRFRPTLVVGGAAAFAEDTWAGVTIGEIYLRAAGPCARCLVTTTDQLTGLRGAEPLRTLSRYRRDPTENTKVNFGQNLIHETKTGIIRVGDAVVPDFRERVIS
jgi:uncharacterized protein YcbX